MTLSQSTEGQGSKGIQQTKSRRSHLATKAKVKLRGHPRQAPAQLAAAQQTAKLALKSQGHCQVAISESSKAETPRVVPRPEEEGQG